MGRWLARIAELELARGTGDHLEDGLGDLLLDAEEAQRRAALAGRTKRRRDDVVGHLLRQRGGIDDHRIDAAGFGDEGHDRCILGRERAVDRARHLGRSREGNAGDARIGDQRRAHLAVARNQMQCTRRHARLVQNAHGLGGDQRGLLGRLRHHGIAASPARRSPAREDRQREIPRADADEDAAAALAAARWTRRSDRAARAPSTRAVPARHNSGRNRRPRAHSASASSRVLPPSACSSPMSLPRRASSRSPARSSAAARVSTGSAAHAAKPACAAAMAAAATASLPSRTRADRFPSIGELTGRSLPARGSPLDDQRPQPTGIPAAADVGQQRRQARAIAELHAGRIAPRRSVEVARQRDARIACVRWAHRSGSADAPAASRPAPKDRRRPRRKRNWRRSRAGGARDRRADRGGRRPAHRPAPRRGDGPRAAGS